MWRPRPDDAERLPGAGLAWPAAAPCALTGASVSAVPEDGEAADAEAADGRLLQRLLMWDGACVQASNRLLAYPKCNAVARAVSRLGDGELWGATILVLAVMPGHEGLHCALQLLGATLLGLLIYKLVKDRAARARPYVRLAGLRLCAPALDEHSFPSGHVLHAVAFAAIVTAHFPLVGLLLIPFALLTGIVRVVLALHYPSDVIAGIAIGATVAGLSFLVSPL